MSIGITDKLIEELSNIRNTTNEPAQRKVLVVDDNQHDAILLGDMLKQAGCEVDIANGGELAMQLVRNARPYSMLFLDLNFPVGPSGAEILRYVRKLIPDMQVTIITGFSTPDLESVAKSIGCHILAKPAQVEELIRLFSGD